jgi:hypothetical protein
MLLLLLEEVYPKHVLTANLLCSLLIEASLLKLRDLLPNRGGGGIKDTCIIFKTEDTI